MNASGRSRGLLCSPHQHTTLSFLGPVRVCRLERVTCTMDCALATLCLSNPLLALRRGVEPRSCALVNDGTSMRSFLEQ